MQILLIAIVTAIVQLPLITATHNITVNYYSNSGCSTPLSTSVVTNGTCFYGQESTSAVACTPGQGYWALYLFSNGNCASPGHIQFTYTGVDANTCKAMGAGVWVMINCNYVATPTMSSGTNNNNNVLSSSSTGGTHGKSVTSSASSSTATSTSVTSTASSSNSGGISYSLSLQAYLDVSNCDQSSPDVSFTCVANTNQCQSVNWGGEPVYVTCNCNTNLSGNDSVVVYSDTVCNPINAVTFGSGGSTFGPDSKCYNQFKDGFGSVILQCTESQSSNGMVRIQCNLWIVGIMIGLLYMQL